MLSYESESEERVIEKGGAVDFSGEGKTSILGFKRSEYSTIRLIRTVNTVDQDRHRELVKQPSEDNIP
jgi:hypothetical protein